MPGPVVRVDQARIRRLQQGLTAVFRDGGKLADKATRAGYRRMAVPVARNLRRSTRSAGYRGAAKAIGSQLSVKKHQRGRRYTMRTGVRTRSEKYAAIWHWLNLGTRRHFQPNAWRPVPGTNRLRPVPGGAQHRGTTGKFMRNKAARVGIREATGAFDIGFNRVYRRELKKRANK